MGKKTLTLEIETCDARDGDQAHCDHKSPYTYASNPPQWDETCCFCGRTKRVSGHSFDSANARAEHGPHVRQTLLYNSPTRQD